MADFCRQHFQTNFVNENVYILMQISLKLPACRTNDGIALSCIDMSEIFIWCFQANLLFILSYTYILILCCWNAVFCSLVPPKIYSSIFDHQRNQYC